jgi:hypothetical protein
LAYEDDNDIAVLDPQRRALLAPLPRNFQGEAISGVPSDLPVAPPVTPPGAAPAAATAPGIAPAVKPPGFAERYGALQAEKPQRTDPKFAVPGWKKALGFAAATLGGTFNPRVNAGELYHNVLAGPYEKALGDWTQKEGAIKTEAGLADTEAQMRQRDELAKAESAKAEATLHPPMKPKEESWKTVPGVIGPEGKVLQEEQSSGQIRWAPGITGAGPVKTAADTAIEEQKRYEGIVQKQNMKQQVSPEDVAWKAAYEKNKTLGPYAQAAAQAPERATARGDKSYEFHTKQIEAIRKPIAERADRIGRLITSIDQGTPLADSLIAPELLTAMAGGQGSGLRMNEAEISRIVGGKDNWEKLKSSLLAWRTDPSKPFQFLPPQREQAYALIRAIGEKVQRKNAVLEKAENALIDADTPVEHRRILADARRELDKIDSGTTPEAKGGQTKSGITIKRDANGRIVGVE